MQIDFEPDETPAATIAFEPDEPAAEKPVAPTTGFIPSAQAAAAQSTLNTVAAVADLAPQGVAIGEKPFRPEDQSRWDQLVAERNDIENVDAHQVEGGGGLPNPRLLQIAHELQGLSRAPVADTAAGQLRDAAGQSFEYYGADPAARNTAAQVGRGVGAFGANLPAIALSLPVAGLQMAGNAYQSAYGAKEKELRDRGETNETLIADQAQQAASTEAVKSAPALAAYMVGGKLASSAVAGLLPEASAVVKGIAGSIAGAGANVTVGSATRAIEGHDALPNLEQLTQDVLWGIVHGAGEYSKATTGQKTAAKAEIQRRSEQVARIDSRLEEIQKNLGPRQEVDPKTEKVRDARIFTNEEKGLLAEKRRIESPDGVSAVDLARQVRERMAELAATELEQAGAPETAAAVREAASQPRPANEEPVAPRQDTPEPAPVEESPLPPEPVSSQTRAEEASAEPVVEPEPVSSPEKPAEPTVVPEEQKPTENTPEPIKFEPDPDQSAPTPESATPDVPPAAEPVVAPDNSPTSIKNAVVDQERVKRGLPPAIEPARRAFGTVWDDAMRRIDADSDAPRNLVEDLEKNPRPISDTEDAILLHRQITLQNEHDTATSAAVAAHDAGDPAAAEEHRLRTAFLSDELQRVYDVGKKVGTEQGRGLNARKMMRNSDYSLAAMVTKKRAASGGKPLSEEAQKEVETQHAEMEAAKQREEAATAKADETSAKDAAEDAVKQVVKKVNPPRKRAPKATTEAKQASPRTVSWLEKQAEAARARIAERRKNTFADPLGVMTTIDLADRAIVGAADIAGGLRDFAGWAAKQLSQWGDAIRPHIEDLWTRSNALLEQREATSDVVEKMAARAQEGATLGDLRPYVQRIAETLVRSGVTELEPLLDTLHPILEDVVPGTSRRQTMDLFSGYGEFKQLSKDQVAVQIRELKGEAQQQGKIEDMLAGQAPKKTGMERRTPSDKERAKIKIVNELKKLGGFKVTDPETQLKSALQAQERGFANAIKDIAAEIDTGERRPAAGTSPSNARTEMLRSLLNRLRETREQVFGSRTRELTDAQRLKLATDAANRVADEYERQVREEDLARKKGKPTLTSPELEAAKARRDAAKAERDELRALDDAISGRDAELREKQLADQIAELDRKLQVGDLSTKPARAGEPSPTAESLAAERDAMRKLLNQLRRESNRPVLTDAEKEVKAQQRALLAYKTRTAKKIAELADKAAREDYSPAPPRRTVQLDAEALRAKADLERVRNDYERGLIKDRLSKRDTWERALDGAAKWRRAFVLSGVRTLAKLTSAATEIIGIAPIEEAAGGVIGQLPIVRKVAAKAPRQGGFSLSAEVEAITANVTKLFSDMGTYMAKGGTDLDAVFGEPHLYPFEWKELVGRLHGALKTPARRNEWTRSFRKRMDFAARQGADITDPMVQMKLGMEAYKDANKSIFMESNMVVDAYKRAMSRFEQVDKTTGKPSLRGKAASTGLKVLLPVIRIPTNIVARTFEYTLGTVSGSARLARAMKEGLPNLKPEEAELIMQNLKRGSLGAGVLLLGFFNPQNVGGYYTGKRDEKDVKAGEVKIFGVTIPKYLVHNPLLEQLQIGATVRRVMDSKLRKSDKETQGIGAGIWAAGLGLVEEVPFVGQALRLDKLFNPHEREQYLGELAKSVIVPQGAQDAAKWLDEDPSTGEATRRDPKTAIEFVETAIPGLRENVPVKKKR